LRDLEPELVLVGRAKRPAEELHGPCNHDEEEVPLFVERDVQGGFGAFPGEQPARLLHGPRAHIEAGEESRFVEALPLKLVIIDETIVMFGMQDPVGSGGDLTIMVVEHPSLAKVLKTSFESTWAQGLTIQQAAAAHAAGQRKSA